MGRQGNRAGCIDPPPRASGFGVGCAVAFFFRHRARKWPLVGRHQSKTDLWWDVIWEGIHPGVGKKRLDRVKGQLAGPVPSSPHPQQKSKYPSRVVGVFNLPRGLEEADLEDLFHRYGKVLPELVGCRCRPNALPKNSPVESSGLSGNTRNPMGDG